MFFELAILAYLIDMIFGEFPSKHPVIYMGDFIIAFEQRFYSNRNLSGALLVLALILSCLVISIALVYLCETLPVSVSLPLLALMASTGLAMNMLYSSVAEILTTQHPKQSLSLLVSRDTDTMIEADIYKAALETWAENLSDGVIAPLFYLVLFGLPGIAAYKAINTLDSMIAYKTERYFYFGKTAAIIDDIANYIPARLTALLIVLLATNKPRAWQSTLCDAKKMESPNAGYPISALAGALGVSLGGDAYYHGKLKHKPILGLPFNPINKDTLASALKIRTGVDAIILGLLTLFILL